MHYVVTAREMQALDATTIEDIGLPGAVLMETAGRRVAEVVFELIAKDRAQVAVVCGAGNNGGDGYVIARCLRERKIAATVYLAAPEDKLAGDARLHYEVYRKVGGEVVAVVDEASLAEHAGAITGADIAVDAVFGTGLAREVRGHYRRIIETINQSRGLVVAVDIPSGLAADTGETLGVSVKADHTVTMAFAKIGLVTSPGFARAGVVHPVEIGIPESLARARGVSVLLYEQADFAALVPQMSLLDHKNRRGHLLAVAGSRGKRGAARLLSWAALRAGAGLVTVAAPAEAGGEIAMPDPVMTAILDPDAEGADPAAALAELMRGKRAVAMGPGMPVSAGGRALVHAALAAELVVLDADALNHLEGDLAAVARAPGPVIMTPHPGEAARLLGVTPGDIERDRVASVRKLAERSRAIAVLKGARTLVCDGRGLRDSQAGDQARKPDPLLVSINPSGGPSLATAGSGDVLTGVIAALATQGLDAADAARLGTYLHGRAGDLAARALGPWSVTAADLADFLPAALTELRPGCRSDWQSGT